MGDSTIQGLGPSASASMDALPDSPNSPPRAMVVNGEMYRPQWDFRTGTWDMVDKLGRSLYGSTVAATPIKPQQCQPGGSQVSSALGMFQSSAQDVLRKDRRQQAMQDALSTMMKERGQDIMRIKERMEEMRAAEPNYMNQRTFSELRSDLLQIFAEYAPKEPVISGPVCKADADADRHALSPPGNSPSTPSGTFVPLPTGVNAAGSRYAPDIAPQHPRQWGDVGGLDFEHDAIRASVEHAYAYDGEVPGTQVANDMERLARGNYSEIHVLSGAHGAPNSGIGAPDPDQLNLDRLTATQVEQRHPGLKVVVHDASNRAELLDFIRLQSTAAAGRSPNVATLDAICNGRNRMSDPHGGPPTPPVAAQESGLTRADAAVFGAASVFSGLLMVDSGRKEPNSNIAAAKMASGAAQIAGGTAYVVGTVLESNVLTKTGSVVGEAGGYAAAPLVAYDVYRHMSRHIEGDPRPQAEKDVEGLNDSLAVGGLLFPEFAAPALGISLVFMPMANHAAEKAAPVFVGAMSQAYGIPESVLWKWSGQH